MEKILSEHQLLEFRANGILHIPGLIPESVYGPVRDDLGRMIDAGKEAPGPDYTYLHFESSSGRSWLYRINELIGTHELESVKLMLAYPPLLSAVYQAMGRGNFASTAAAVVLKMPNSEAPVGWHQDPVPVHRWPVFDTDIYLDESDPDNGGLWAIPGSHLGGYHASQRKELIESYTRGCEGGEVDGAVPVVAQPGDVNFHANSVVHGSFASKSPRLRRTLYFHWDSYDDVALKPEDNQFRTLYPWAERLLKRCIEMRAERYPNEAPFPVELFDSPQLPGASDEWHSWHGK